MRRSTKLFKEPMNKGKTQSQSYICQIVCQACDNQAINSLN